MVKPSIHRPTKATVNLKAIEHNINWLKSQIDDKQKIYATVKADGYGHAVFLPIACASRSLCRCLLAQWRARLRSESRTPSQYCR